MGLVGYMNAPTEPSFLDSKHSKEYLMHHTHETILYARKKIDKINENLHQCYFKADDAEINKNKEYSNFLQKYCDEDHSRYISYRLSGTSTVHIVNGTPYIGVPGINMKPQEAVTMKKHDKCTQDC